MSATRQQYETYLQQYQMLGLGPAAEPDEIKQAFRAHIKKHHPDTAQSEAEAEHARVLIEAYRSIKDAPLATMPEPAPDTLREENNRRSRTGRVYPDMRGREDLAYRMGKQFGEEIFGRGDAAEEETSGARPKRTAEFHDFWSRLAEGVYSDDEEAAVYGAGSDVREFFPNRRPRRRDPLDDLDFLRDDVKLYYKRAEVALREIVTTYDNRRDRGKKGWARDYLRNLMEVQVLFRDLQRRYPILNTRAGGRVRQIGELASEIKKMAR